MNRALTVGVISKLLGAPAHRIDYLIRTRRIEPVQRAGNLRVFDAKAVETLRAELKQSNTRMCGDPVQ